MSDESLNNRSDEVLNGQVALVTGGGTGIGLGCAEALVADGASVVLAARDLRRLEAAAEDLRSRHDGAEISTIACDVTDESSVEDACGHAAAQGPLRIVVANAGYGSAAPLHLTSLDEWNGVIGTNLTGAFLTMKHSVGYLVANGGDRSLRFHRSQLSRPTGS